MTALEAACLLDPSSLDAHVRLGLAYQELERFDESIAPLSKAAELRPEQPIFHMRRAHLRVRLADLDGAERDLAVLHELASATDGGRLPPAWVVDGAVVTGAQLMRRGLQPPALYAESVLLVELTREG